MSYTNFKISEPTLDHAEISRTGSAMAMVTVNNTGARDGEDVVQLYVHHQTSSVVQPVILLKDFKRVTVRQGSQCGSALRTQGTTLAVKP